MAGRFRLETMSALLPLACSQRQVPVIQNPVAWALPGSGHQPCPPTPQGHTLTGRAEYMAGSHLRFWASTSSAEDKAWLWAAGESQSQPDCRTPSPSPSAPSLPAPHVPTARHPPRDPDQPAGRSPVCQQCPLSLNRVSDPGTGSDEEGGQPWGCGERGMATPLWV